MTQIVVAGLEDVEAMFARLPENAKFGASVGLNRTADEVQAGIRAGLQGKGFTLRRKTFVEQTIYRKPGEDFARKDQPEMFARVRIHEERDVLAKHEEGGQKRPRQGRVVAVPIGARPTKDALVPAKYTLKALFFNQQSRWSQVKTIATTKSKTARRRLLKRSVASDVTVTPDGRVWLTEGRGKSRRSTLLWVFKKATWVPPRLKFEETGRAIATNRLRPNVEGAIEIELTRGLSTSSKPTAK